MYLNRLSHSNFKTSLTISVNFGCLFTICHSNTISFAQFLKPDRKTFRYPAAILYRLAQMNLFGLLLDGNILPDQYP